jgi:hypothetical protein
MIDYKNSKKNYEELKEQLKTITESASYYLAGVLLIATTDLAKGCNEILIFTFGIILIFISIFNLLIAIIFYLYNSDTFGKQRILNGIVKSVNYVKSKTYHLTIWLPITILFISLIEVAVKTLGTEIRINYNTPFTATTGWILLIMITIYLILLFKDTIQHAIVTKKFNVLLIAALMFFIFSAYTFWCFDSIPVFSPIIMYISGMVLLVIGINKI